MAKQVVDVKGDQEKPEVKKDEKIQVIQGNLGVIQVQLLNSINQNLISILGMLKVLANKIEKELKDG